jgi:hypothetical protein
MNQKIGNLEEIVVGDQVILANQTLFGETRAISADVIEVRYILGKQTYVVETEQGKRKVVSASQISKIEPLN